MPTDEPSKLSISDLFQLTAVMAVLMVLAMVVRQIIADPIAMLNGWPLPLLAELMMLCLLGMAGFPILILFCGFAILHRTQSRLKRFYKLLILGLAMASVPLALIVARACALLIV